MAKGIRRRKQSAKAKKSRFSKAISTLRGMRGHQRYNAIRYANDNFIRDLCSNINKLRYKKLTRKEEEIVRKYNAKLKVLCDRRKSIQKKRQMLSQKGGILPFILPLVAPLVVKAITGNL